MINNGKPRFRADLPMRLEGVHIGVGPGVKAREQGLAFSLLCAIQGLEEGRQNPGADTAPLGAILYESSLATS
ncbi:hypothetical protein [Rhodomicrobium sp.]|uniref:hypothetical protein n=1 Tax=Rhodomicrobium sp. TaxID=2720632 RepID=UPI0039E5057D